MTFKIVNAIGDWNPDFEGTRRAGNFLKKHVDFGSGAAEGKRFLTDIRSNVLSVSPVKMMVDASNKDCYDQNGNPVVKVNIAKDDSSSRVYNMALPAGNIIDTEYLEYTLSVLKERFDAGAKPSDEDMKDFMLGMILLMKCR